MEMIRHPIDRNQFLFLVSHYAGNVFVKVFFDFGFDQGESVANCEDGLNVDLGKVFAIAFLLAK